MIRLTLLLLAGMGVAMLIWGEDDAPMRAATITSVPLDAVAPPAPAAVPEPAATQPAPKVEVASLDALDLTRVGRSGGLLVFDAKDAPADAVPLTGQPETPVIRDAEAGPETLLVVTGSRVNLRAGPSTAGEIVGRLQRGAQAELVAEAPGGWLKIRDVSSGTVGFMSGAFLTASN